MQAFHPKLWTGLGSAVLLTASAACSGEGGEGGAAPASASGEGAAASGEGEGVKPAATSAGEGEGGSAAGEGGAAAAYAALPADSQTALRLAHLKGFFLAALPLSRQGPEAAAALAGQGMLEVFDPAAAQLEAGGLDVAALRRAAETGERGALQAAVAALDAAQRAAGGDPAAVARGLSSIAAGLYGEAAGGGALDPIEYQHAYGAALALRDQVRREPGLAEARADADRLAAMWPSPVAPETLAGAPALAEVRAQASRVELALSGL